MSGVQGFHVCTITSSFLCGGGDWSQGLCVLGGHCQQKYAQPSAVSAQPLLSHYRKGGRAGRALRTQRNAIQTSAGEEAEGRSQSCDFYNLGQETKTSSGAMIQGEPHPNLIRGTSLNFSLGVCMCICIPPPPHACHFILNQAAIQRGHLLEL